MKTTDKKYVRVTVGRYEICDEPKAIEDASGQVQWHHAAPIRLIGTYAELDKAGLVSEIDALPRENILHGYDSLEYYVADPLGIGTRLADELQAARERKKAADEMGRAEAIIRRAERETVYETAREAADAALAWQRRNDSCYLPDFLTREQVEAAREIISRS